MKTILHAPGVAPQSLPADLEAASNPSDSSLKVLVTTRPWQDQAHSPPHRRHLRRTLPWIGRHPTGYSSSHSSGHVSRIDALNDA